MDGIAAELAEVRLFADVDADVLDDLASHAFVRRLGRGQVLFTEGEPSEHMYVVRSGLLRVLVVSPRGEELVLSVLGPGQALGELSVLDGLPRSASAEAIDATELVAVPAAAARAVLLGRPAALLAVAVELAAGMRRLTGNAADLVFLDLPRRLAKLLLTTATVAADGSQACDLGMSQAGVASRLGVTRQSLNRALVGFARRGWIAVDGTHVSLLDVAALQRFADS